MIGKIRRVGLRELWRHEAADFTTWLENNIDVLEDTLDVSLANVEREQNAGAFSVDLVAKDQAGQPVIVENQLEPSDHDHLGKIITYLTALKASAAIWIVSQPRPERVNAVARLNETSGARFYLVKVEAIRIDDSPPAPLLTLITGPSDELMESSGCSKKELAGIYSARKRFWTSLLARAKATTKLHATNSPGEYSYIRTSAGIRGINFSYVIRRHDALVELYIDRTSDMGEWNEQILQKLAAHREEIEQQFGGPLEWVSHAGRRACHIRTTISGGGWQDEEHWPQVQDAMTDAMIRLERVLRGHVKALLLGE
jgi:hypothetical protein